MGGTSTDVCLIVDGAAGAGQRARGRGAADPAADRRHPHGRCGRRLDRAASTRAARSASGPRAPARIPGPACYGRGGERPDGDGREPGARAGCRRGSPAVSSSTWRPRSARSGRSTRAAVVEIVNAEMLRALRVVSVERGLDPRDFALVAFGGAGPLHACALADELEIRTVLVPEAAGVLSALGLVAGDERRDRVESRARSAQRGRRAPARGRGRPPLRRPVVRADGAAPVGPGGARSTVRTRSATATPTRNARSSSSPCERPTSARGRQFELPAGRRGATSKGPAVLEQPGSTVFLPPGWVGVRDGSSTLRVTKA